MSDTPLVYMLLLNIAEQKYHEDHESYIFAEKAQPFLQATLFGDATNHPMDDLPSSLMLSSSETAALLHPKQRK